MIAMLVKLFDTMAKMVEGIISVQDTIITLYLLDNNKKNDKLKQCIDKVK